MFFVFCVLSFMLFLIALILLRRSPKGIIFSIDNIIILGVAFLWGILFPAVYFYSLKNQNNEYLIIISNYDALELIFYYVCVVVFLFLFVKIFRLSLGKINSNLFVYEDKGTEYGDDSARLYIATVILFIVGVLSDLLYCQAYGGYFGYLEYSAYVRSGITNLVHNRWSFLIVVRDCVIISSFLFFGQIKKNNRVQLGRVLFFILSLIYSFLILYANKGRLSFIIYIVVFLIAYLVYKEKLESVSFKSIFYVLGLFLIFILGSSWVSSIVGRASEFSGIELITNEISFVFANFKLLLNETEIGDFRFFIDIVFYPLFLLPSSLWRKILPDTASDVMTILAFGNKKGSGGVLGETPIDAISIGYLQFGVIGIFIFAMFFGVVSAKLYKKTLKFSNARVRTILQAYLMVDIFLRSLIYADSYNIVQRCFSLVVFALIFWGVGLLQKKKV